MQSPLSTITDQARRMIIGLVALAVPRSGPKCAMATRPLSSCPRCRRPFEIGRGKGVDGLYCSTGCAKADRRNARQVPFLRDDELDVSTGRTCGRCGQALPQHMKLAAVYCSGNRGSPGQGRDLGLMACRDGSAPMAARTFLAARRRLRGTDRTAGRRTRPGCQLGPISAERLDEGAGKVHVRGSREDQHAACRTPLDRARLA